MKYLSLDRYLFTGMLWIPKEDPTASDNTAVLTYVKDINFDFTGDPGAPRSVIVALEPFPTTAQITNIRNRYDEEMVPLSEWTVTSVEPIINPFRRVEAYRHQVAMSNQPDFGYEVVRD